MDIISEILETDRLAEEKLEQAMQKRSEMLEECEKKVERIKENAKSEVELYRSFLISEEELENCENELKQSEREQLDALVAAYEACHEDWENDIIAVRDVQAVATPQNAAHVDTVALAQIQLSQGLSHPL